MLSLAVHHRDQIQVHAQDCYPAECCGLMLGQIAAIKGQLHKKLMGLYPTANAWDPATTSVEEQTSQQALTTARRYWIAPQDLFAAQKYARTQGWDIIGVYHSHPNHEAVPSECDRKWAWPQYSYVIVAVNNGKTSEFQSWMLDDQQQFQPEAVSVSTPSVTSTFATDF